jgi:hypothetical protein
MDRAPRVRVVIFSEFNTNPIGFEGGEDGDESIGTPSKFGLRYPDRRLGGSTRGRQNSALIDEALSLEVFKVSLDRDRRSGARFARDDQLFGFNPVVFIGLLTRNLDLRIAVWVG